MKLYELLAEGRTKTRLEEDDIIKLFQGDYSESLALLDRPIYRGTRGDLLPYYLQHESDVDRRSISYEGYHYTELLDSNPLNKGWPRRKRSTITSSSPKTAESYTDFNGIPYAVFPRNGTKLAVAPYDDIWRVEVDLVDGSLVPMKLLHLHRFMERYYVAPEGLTVDNLEERLKDGAGTSRTPPAMNDPRQAFSYEEMGVKLQPLSQPVPTESREIWFEGPSIMIRADLLPVLKAELKDQGVI